MEEGNSGIRFTTGLLVTLVTLSIMLSIFVIIWNNGKEVQRKETELRQQENDSISYNVEDRNNALTTLSSNYYFNC